VVDPQEEAEGRSHHHIAPEAPRSDQEAVGDTVQRSYEETGAFHAQETEAVHGEQGSDDQVLVFFKECHE
jgi:hypothetical protein